MLRNNTSVVNSQAHAHNGRVTITIALSLRCGTMTESVKKLLSVSPQSTFNKDSLSILQGISSNCVDLIYLGPPFSWEKVFSASMVGSCTEGTDFFDISQEGDIRGEWVESIEYRTPGLYEYIKGVKSFTKFIWFAWPMWLMGCYRVLKDTFGLTCIVILVISHYLKIVLDCVFGEHRFMSDIIKRCCTGGLSKYWFFLIKKMCLQYSILLTHKNKTTSNPIKETIT